MTEITTTNIMFFIGIISVIFNIYLYFRKPQEKLEKESLLNQERDKGKASIFTQQAIENKATAISQQMQWEKESVEKRFNEMGKRLDSAFELAQNHIHTIDTKVDTVIKDVGFLTNEITRLSTIIEERIPKK